MKKQARRAQSRRIILPHRHTGKLVHHRHTSYALLTMIVFCVGLFLAAWTRHVQADVSYDVNARVQAPLITQPATITSPAANAVFTTGLINVTGGCQINSYVSIYDNGIFMGSALCSAQGSYQLQISLFKGGNKLQANIFNITGDPGPLSTLVTVFYRPPAASAATASIGTLLIKTDFTYAGQIVGKPVKFDIDIEGGTSPYAFSVDWGDGQHDLISRRNTGSFTIQHVYNRAGDYRGSYVVRLTASDGAGRQAVLQLFAIVNNQVTAGGSTSPGSPNSLNPEGDSYLSQLFKYTWPTYGIIVASLFSFWLGERYEMHRLLFRKIRHP